MARTAALDLLLAVTVLLGEDMRRGLEALGLTETRSHVLWLVGTDGPTTQQQLAVATSLAPRSVTSVVDALVEAGLVERRPHPSDRRAVHVTATEAGATMVAGLVASHERLADQLFGDLGEATYDATHAVLGDLAARLQTLVAEEGA